MIGQVEVNYDWYCGELKKELVKRGVTEADVNSEHFKKIIDALATFGVWNYNEAKKYLGYQNV